MIMLRLKKLIKGTPIIGGLVVTILGFIRKFRGGDSDDGKQFYDPKQLKNAGFQTYFIENKYQIESGNVPDRYMLIANATLGSRVLELGSADGTQCLVLAREKDLVCGVELMELQYLTALELKQKWIANGVSMCRCEFFLGGIPEFKKKLPEYETVLMSRVLYHLRSEIYDVMDAISKSNVTHVVLVGCPDRSRRYKEGGLRGDAMGKYAKFASKEGMEEILEKYGFSISLSAPNDNGFDPIVVGHREISSK